MFKTRLIAGSIAGLVVLCALFIPGLPGALIFTAMALFLVVGALVEYESLAGKLGSGGIPLLAPIFGCLLVACLAAWPMAWPGRAGGGAATELFLLIVFLLAACITVFQHQDMRPALLALAVSITGLAVFYGTLGFIPKLYFHDGLGMAGRHLVLFLLVVTKSSDIGAYAAGSYTARRPGGNHKMTPRLSPKKSWEGLAGGILASVLAAVLITAAFGGTLSLRGVPLIGFKRAIVLGVVLALLGAVGDLAESALKRSAGAKDSGRIPGLGGVLDMTDSLLFAAPAFYVFISYCLGALC